MRAGGIPTGLALLVVGASAGILISSNARSEYDTLRELRKHGVVSEATVIAVTQRSRTDRPVGLDVRHGTAEGTVDSKINVAGTSAAGSTTGDRFEIVYNPRPPYAVRLPEELGAAQLRDDAIAASAGICASLAGLGIILATVIWARKSATQQV